MRMIFISIKNQNIKDKLKELTQEAFEKEIWSSNFYSK